MTDETPSALPAPPPLEPEPVFTYAPPGARAPDGPAGAPRITRRAGVLLLVLGLTAGAGAVYGITRVTEPGGTVSIRVDNTPVHAATGNAEAVAQQLIPEVGTIIARTGSSTSASLGSGFVISNSSGVSYLVTNNHVVTGSNDLHVAMPDGAAFTATLIGTDTLDDLAVVSVPSGALPVATFGDSSQLKVGQSVIAIGSPLGNQSSVTAGVLSALHRTITASGENASSSETLEDVLQTDASINPGNSGGPLADVEGRVIGVNVAVAGSSTNIGYSIPANLAREVAQALIAHRKVQHPFLGVAYLDSIDAIEAGQGFNGPGVLVTQVTAGTPAAAAGFQAKDILVAIDGVKIDNGQTLGGLIQGHHDGDRIACTVQRGGRTLTLTATLEERPSGL